MMRIVVLSNTVGLCLLFLACNAPVFTSITRAFYCWQTTLSLSADQRDYLQQTGCKKLYVKVADIRLEAGTDEIIPFSQLQLSDTTGLAAVDIVRVVFITNDVFLNISVEKMSWLAEQLVASQARLDFPPSASGRREFR